MHSQFRRLMCISGSMHPLHHRLRSLTKPTPKRGLRGRLLLRVPAARPAMDVSLKETQMAMGEAVPSLDESRANSPAFLRCLPKAPSGRRDRDRRSLYRLRWPSKQI